MANETRIRALLITTDYPPDIGGLQTYSLRIAKGLPAGMLAAVLVGSDRHRRVLPAPGAGVALASRHGRTRWSAFWWSLWSVPWFRLRHKAGFLVHMQWTTAIPSMVLSRLLPGTRYLVLVHGAELIDPGRWLVGLVKGAVLSRADAVVAGSHHTAEIVRQLGIRCRRLEVIPYGNPLEGMSAPTVGESLPPIAPGPRLLCMHRLVPRKGTALLLEALAGLKDRRWSLDIVGRGEDEERLKEQIVLHKMQDRVRILPPVDENMKLLLLRDASLFILPSLPPVLNNHVEGLGLTLLESQSQGLPVLAARTGGIPEAVQEGRTGILFRAGDAKDLREKLAELLTAPEKLRAMGKEGPGWVGSHFSWEASLAKLAGVMKEIGEGGKFIVKNEK